MPRDWKGIWIPREVWEDRRLTWYDKIILMEIDSFTQRDQPCFVSDRHLSEFVGIAERTVRKSLSNLVELGLVERAGFDGRKRFLRSLLPGNSAPTAAQPGTVCLPARHEEPKKKTNTETKEQIVYPWDSEEFVQIWTVWKEDRRERKIKRYTARGEQAALHKLHNDTNGDEAQAIAAIQNSIANGYQGIFPDRKGAKRVAPKFTRERLDAWANQGTATETDS